MPNTIQAMYSTVRRRGCRCGGLDAGLSPESRSRASGVAGLLPADPRMLADLGVFAIPMPCLVVHASRSGSMWWVGSWIKRLTPSRLGKERYLSIVCRAQQRHQDETKLLPSIGRQALANSPWPPRILA